MIVWRIVGKLKKTIFFSAFHFVINLKPLLPSLIEARAISNMLRHQTGTATEMALVPKLSTGRRYRIDYEQLEQLKRDTDEFQKDITEQAESSRPPGNLLTGQEVVAAITPATSKIDAHSRENRQVDDQHGNIEGAQHNCGNHDATQCR